MTTILYIFYYLRHYYTYNPSYYLRHKHIVHNKYFLNVYKINHYYCFRFSVKVLLALCQQAEKRPLAGVIVIGNGHSARAVALSGSAMHLPVLWAKGGTANLDGMHREVSQFFEHLILLKICKCQRLQSLSNYKVLCHVIVKRPIVYSRRKIIRFKTLSLSIYLEISSILNKKRYNSDHRCSERLIHIRT